MKCKLFFLGGLVFALIFILGFSSHLIAQESDEGKALFEAKCGKCHSLSKSLEETKNLEKWKETALRMSKKKNSGINQKEAEKIAGYLNLANSQ